MPLFLSPSYDLFGEMTKETMRRTFIPWQNNLWRLFPDTQPFLTHFANKVYLPASAVQQKKLTRVPQYWTRLHRAHGNISAFNRRNFTLML